MSVRNRPGDFVHAVYLHKGFGHLIRWSSGYVGHAFTLFGQSDEAWRPGSCQLPSQPLVLFLVVAAGLACMMAEERVKGVMFALEYLFIYHVYCQIISFYFVLLWPEPDHIDRPQIYRNRHILIYWFWSFFTQHLDQYWPQKLHIGRAAVVTPKGVISL